ncbi:MAG: 50S ribosomal protein L18 [Alphaproteobacteria bacterium MarineAlpha2_Bin1]|nr:MAG: 50S ribosomal protein L18 [Alphaproteobacteria bacterium MarineAlpha2_Bin1]
MSEKYQANKRQQRVRSSLKKKSNGRLRLTVFRSNYNIYAQIIDDKLGKTLVSASSLEIETKAEKPNAKKELAVITGKKIAERASAAGIKEVVFDRGRYLYHGRVKALADAAREAGLVF